jgi:hypothetical protein
MEASTALVGRLHVKFAKAVWDPEHHGFFVDPHPYLAELPAFLGRLPAGAREFASDPGHYDMRSAHCVKDLELSGVRVATDKSGGLVLEFSPNRFKHDGGLAVTYVGVRHFSIDYLHEIDWMDADTVLLDEILPTGDDDGSGDGEGGCVHEIVLTDATVTVRCADLRAVWQA